MRAKFRGAATQPVLRIDLRSLDVVAPPWPRSEGQKEGYYESRTAQMIHEGFNWVGFTVLVLMMVVLLPAAALLTRALIPFTAATITVLFIASCCSRRMRDWLYS